MGKLSVTIIPVATRWQAFFHFKLTLLFKSCRTKIKSGSQRSKLDQNIKQFKNIFCHRFFLVSKEFKLLIIIKTFPFTFLVHHRSVPLNFNKLTNSFLQVPSREQKVIWRNNYRTINFQR